MAPTDSETGERIFGVELGRGSGVDSGIEGFAERVQKGNSLFYATRGDGFAIDRSRDYTATTLAIIIIVEPRAQLMLAG